MPIALLTALVLVAAPQPPDISDAEAVLAWARREGVSEQTTAPAARWNMIAATPDGLMMAGMLARKDAAGKARLGLRTERYAAQGGVLSEVVALELDCAAKSAKPVEVARYPGRNLGGEARREAVSQAAFAVPQDSDLGDLVAPACSVDHNDPVAVTAFLREIGAFNEMVSDIRFYSAQEGWLPNPGTEWVFAGARPDGVVLAYRRVHYTAIGVGGFTARLERFEPLVVGGAPMLSQETGYDVRCFSTGRQVRVTVETDYPQRGLKGRPVRKPVRNAPWVDAKDTVFANVIGSLCNGVRPAPSVVPF